MKVRIAPPRRTTAAASKTVARCNSFTVGRRCIPWCCGSASATWKETRSHDVTSCCIPQPHESVPATRWFPRETAERCSEAWGHGASPNPTNQSLQPGQRKPRTPSPRFLPWRRCCCIPQPHETTPATSKPLPSWEGFRETPFARRAVASPGAANRPLQQLRHVAQLSGP